MTTLSEIQQRRQSINAELAMQLKKHETMQYDPYVTIPMMSHLRFRINALCDQLDALNREEQALRKAA